MITGGIDVGATLRRRDEVIHGLDDSQAVSWLQERGVTLIRDATTSPRIPPRMLIVGGGVVGVEMVQAFSTLGSQVTVIEAADGLLPGEEAFAGRKVEEALLERGVDARTGASALAARRDRSGVTIELSEGEAIAGDEILLAGRRPLTDDLGLETVGLQPHRLGRADVGGRSGHRL